MHPQGERRGRIYVAGSELKALRDSVRLPPALEDPYRVAALPKVQAAYQRLAEEEPRLPGF